MMRTFWADKRFVVTGGAGFLGRYVVRALRTRGAERVFVPRSRWYDLRERRCVDALFADTEPDIVVHLAAVVGGIGANRDRPADFLHDNALMGLHLIDAAAGAGVEKLVLIGTACSYPVDAPVPTPEAALWDGYPEPTNAPYGLAKRLIVEAGRAYREQVGLRVVTVIPANLYGPGDNVDPASSHVIPALIRKMVLARERGEPEVVVWGSGTPTRDFLYVEDAADGIAAAVERLDDPDPVNLGTGREVSIRELVERVKALTGYEGRIAWDGTKPDGQPRRALDARRARELLDWAAATPFEEGLARTVAWYEMARAGERFTAERTAHMEATD